MNINNMHILRSMSALLLCAAVASCSQEEFVTGKGQALPDGEYPLQFTASVEGMKSRASGKDVWEDNDIIAAKIYPADNSDYPVVGKYILNENGEIKKADPPVAWPYTDGTVKAWFPYVDWDKTITVSIADQSGGMKPYDFLTARAEDKNYKDNIDLTFTHQMAKVTCVLSPDASLTDKEWETAKLSIAGFTEASFCNGEVTGSYSEDNKDKKWITPFYNAEASDSKSQHYEALLVPQNMNGEELIRVEITVTHNGGEVSIPKTLIYTSTETGLEAGKHYVYNITVQKDRLVAQAVTGEWNDDKGSVNADEVPRRVNLNIPELNELSFSDNVTPVYGVTRAGSIPDYLLVYGKEFSISYEISDNSSTKGIVPSVRDEAKIALTRSQSEDFYTFRYTLKSQTEETVGLDYADYVQIGDIYYNDGTWSSNTIEGKIPIGIVFKTDTIGTGDVPGNYHWPADRRIRGYVVALEDASESKGSWQEKENPKDNSQLLLTDGAVKNVDDSRYSGYLDVEQIKESGQFPGKTWACAVADKYQETLPAPVYDKEKPDNLYYSSGWYLPSYKQLRDLYYHYRLNLFFQKADGTPFRTAISDGYWSSTEYRSSTKYSSAAFIMNFYQGPSANSVAKNSGSAYQYVRSVLTF